MGDTTGVLASSIHRRYFATLKTVTGKLRLVAGQTEAALSGDNPMIWLEPEDFAPWRKRLDLERRAGNLTPARRDCLRALLAFVGPGGLFPSDTAVGTLVGHSARTVRRARQDAQALGLLTCDRTRKLVSGRWRQGPNVYQIRHPAGPICSGGQSVRLGRKIERKRPTACRVAPEVPRIALAETRRRMEARIHTAWQARGKPDRPMAKPGEPSQWTTPQIRLTPTNARP
jgi:hypothetical protein